MEFVLIFHFFRDIVLQEKPSSYMVEMAKVESVSILIQILLI